MADDYENWPVNISSGNKPALRPTLKKADDTLTNFNGISKDALVGILLDFDIRNYPLSLSDPNIKDKVTAAQKAKLKEEVNRQKEIAKLNKKLEEEEQKAEREKKRSANAAARSELEQKKETTAVRPAKSKASAQEDEATLVDGEAADRDQDGDVRMAGDEDAAEAPPLVDPTAEAVSSPVDGERKRKRTATVSPSDTKRTRTTRPKTSLIVKLKLKLSTTDGVATGGMQTATQGLGARKRPRQTAGDTCTANTRRTLKKPASRLQHGVASPLELAKPMEGGKNNPDDTVAQELGVVSGSAVPANAPGQLPLRRQPARMARERDVPVDDTLEETEEASEGDPKDNVARPNADRKLTPAELAQVEQLDPNWPKDEHGYPKVFGWNGINMVNYLHRETEEEEREVPYNFLNGPERMLRVQRQTKRLIEKRKEEAKARGEEYVPEKRVEEYDWTKHM
ncbi:hypothetical protein J4E85_000822 [Alternaria conjuncta]|uniref:uncharacterized protein n=1 Tax=Alternaria conjuncta TaxID=181017 RepID=UPI00221E7FE0|nr:uncharacterized protein J4E85_000822 [Alternaria conjuncta]KAI4938382.1 hypothetical protein J4E85_000822 [Alternaria conjuncta]